MKIAPPGFSLFSDGGFPIEWPPEHPTADQIRETRLRANISQVELADQLRRRLAGGGPMSGVLHQRTISAWEQNRQKPRGVNLVHLRRWMERHPPAETDEAVPS